MNEVIPVNVVGTIRYQQEFDVDAIEAAFSSREEITSTTRPDANPTSLFARLQQPETFVAVYRGGSCSILGASSKAEFNAAVETFDDVMFDLIEHRYIPEKEITNIVAETKFDKTPINLEIASVELGLEHAEYNPEQFGGLIYREQNTETTLLIFHSGAILITGATTVEQAEQAAETIDKQLTEVPGVSYETT